MQDQLELLTAALADDYDVERVLGRGGMATVYLAHDIKHERQVAIKVLNPELAGFGYHPERFLREIRIIAGLTHPNILPLHDSGESGGFLYFITPFVEGGSLRERLKRERELDVAEAVAVARAVAGAIDHAHRRDVLHRDLKPENILFSEGQPMVADFGVARAISECCDKYTEVGFAVGTPFYMSPEQATAQDELDGRSDVYALACVLYEMLTGEPPFTGGNPQQIMARHAAEPAAPLRTIRPTVPAGIEFAVAKALAKDPEDRFDSAGAFADALAAPTSAPVVAAAPEARRSIAVLPLVNTSPDPENAYFADGMTDELMNALAKVDGLHVVSRTSVFALQDTRRDIRSIGALLNVSTVLEGSVRKAGSRLRITVQLSDVADGSLLWSERYDREMADVFALQDEIARTLVQTLRATVLGDLGDPTPRRYTGNVTAYNLYLQGRYFWNRRTRQDIEKAVECFEAAIAEDPQYALAYSGLADCYALQVDYRAIPAAEGMERAKVEARKALELDDTLAEAHTSLAWVTFIYDWDWDAAAREYRRAIELNPRYATARQWHAWLLVVRGRLNEALAEGRTALELDPTTVSIRRSVGWLHYYARDWEAAEQHLRRAVEMDPTAPESHRVLGLTLMQMGRYDAAAAALRTAMAPPGESTYALAALSYLEALRGERTDAERLLHTLEDVAKRRYVSPVAFATAHLGLGNVDQVFAALEEAYEQRRGWMAYLKAEPLLEPLLGDPRFRELSERMRLP
jgi:serine/threonine-protein kinase